MKHWQPMTQDELKKYVPDQDGEIERLKEQINEANELLMSAKRLTVKNSQGITMFVLESPEINKYFEKWKV